MKTNPNPDEPEAIDELIEKWGLGDVVCVACKHNVYSHFWNGAGSPENSGWDTCREKDCKCKGEWDEPKPNTIDECDWLKREFVPSKTAKQELLALITQTKREYALECRIEELRWVASLDPMGDWKAEIDTHLATLKSKQAEDKDD